MSRQRSDSLEREAVSAPRVEFAFDSILSLLRDTIRRRGFTQVAVQRELRWKGSYISQLLNRTKALRVEQLLLILEVIDVDPVDFFTNAYRRSITDHGENQGHPAIGVVLLLNQGREVKADLSKNFLERPELIELQDLVEKATDLARDLASATQPYGCDDQTHKSSH